MGDLNTTGTGSIVIGSGSHDITITTNPITVTFEPNGPASVNPSTKIVSENSPYGTLATAQRTGYLFEGWFDSSINGNEIFYYTNVSNSEDHSLYAHWSPIRYYIVFDNNGGSGTMSNMSVYYDTTVNLNDNDSYITKAGYTFNGWSTSADGEGDSYANQASINNLSSINNATIRLYAQWIPTNPATQWWYYETISPGDLGVGVENYNFYNNTDSCADSSTIHSYIKTNNPASENSINQVLSITSYRECDPGVESCILSPTGDIIKSCPGNYYFIALGPDVTASFEGLTGATPSSYSAQDVAPGYEDVIDPTIELGPLLKTGFNFTGWLPTLPRKITENTVFTAQWEVANNTITYNSNDGTNEVETQVKQYDSDINLYNINSVNGVNWSRSYYNFVEWNTQSDGLGDGYIGGSVYSVNSDLTLYAIWDEFQYTLKYNKNYDSALSDTDNTYKYTDTVTIKSENYYTRTNYQFVEWNTESDGSGTSYAADSLQSELSELDNSSITLFAIWIELFDLIYNENVGSSGDSVSSMPSDVLDQTNGTELIIPSITPVRTGYTFQGTWNTEIDGSGTVYDSIFNDTIIMNSNITLYAQWNEHDYNIVYDKNSSSATGTMLQDSSILYSEEINLKTNSYLNDGYYFAGWATTPEGDAIYSDGALVSKLTAIDEQTITLYAVWRYNFYSLIWRDWDNGVLKGPFSIAYDSDLSSSAYNNPSNPTRSGYTFIDWDIEVPLTMPSHDVTINAIYEENPQAPLLSIDSDTTTQIIWLAENLNNEALSCHYTIDGTSPSLLSNSFNIPANDSNTVVTNHTPGENVTFRARFYKTVSGVLVSSNLASLVNGTDVILSFNENGGDSISNQVLEYGTNPTRPTEPIKTGYTFEDWYYDDSSFNNVFDFNEDMMSSDTAHAKWTINQYTLVWKDWDNTILQGPHSLNYNVDLSFYNHPSLDPRTGYTFSGWDKSIPDFMPAYDVTITAQYTQNMWHIYFKEASIFSGTIIDSYLKGYGDSLADVSFPSDPSHVGYIFKGWTNYANESELPVNMPDNDIYIAAKYSKVPTQPILNLISTNLNSLVWKIETNNNNEPNYWGIDFIICYYSHTNTSPGTADSSINVPTADGSFASTTITIEKDSMSNGEEGVLYVRFGYLDNYGEMVYSNVVSSSAHTDVKLSFNSNEGTFISYQQLNYNTSPTEPTDPTRSGYSFEGWYYDDGSFLNPFNFSSNMTASDYAYAKWSVVYPDAIEPTIEYYSDTTSTTSFTIKNNNLLDGLDIYYSNSDSTPDTNDYHIYLEAGETSSVLTIGGLESGTSVTVYCRSYNGDEYSTIDSYTNRTDYQYYEITYDDNGGIGGTTKSFTEGTSSSTVAANAPSVSKTGYDFDDWTPAWTTVTSNKTYTANYTIKTFTVTFEDWDGDTLKTESVDYGDDATTPTNPTRTGYTFTGWSGTYINVTSNRTITATYDINTYTVEFRDYNGDLINSQSVNYGDDADAPSDPTRSGYTFTEWSVSYTNVTSNITTYAQYTANPATTMPSISAFYVIDEWRITITNNDGSAANIYSELSSSSGADPSVYRGNASSGGTVYYTVYDPMRLGGYILAKAEASGKTESNIAEEQVN